MLLNTRVALAVETRNGMCVSVWTTRKNLGLSEMASVLRTAQSSGANAWRGTTLCLIGMQWVGLGAVQGIHKTIKNVFKMQLKSQQQSFVF
jgi:hypothetical protein